MALSANGQAVIKGNHTVGTIEAVDAAEIYNQSFMMLGSRDHGTAAVIGRARAWNDEVGAIPLGFSMARTTGSTSASPIVKAEVDLQGRVHHNIAVTGLTGDVTDVGRVVYATDDDTFTLTRPTLGHPVGIVTEWVSATNASVYFFSFGELCAIGFAGCGRETVFLGTINGVLSAGNHSTGWVAPYHGRITEVYGIVFEPIVDADATATINVEIGGTNVTGGVITFATADVLGDKKAGTAITAANIFHEGDLVDLEVTAGLAGSAADGYMNVFASVLKEPGL
jgi:hypothetical protein